MSGRLIISSKKTYCPWKPENVEKVLKDEAEHKRKEEAAVRDESATTRKMLLEKRMETQKGHFNLFSPEEQAVIGSSAETAQKVKPGIMPVYLDTSSKQKKPFYLNSKAFVGGSQAQRSIDTQRKRAMDPMQEFGSQSNKACEPLGVGNSKFHQLCRQERKHKKRRKEKKSRKSSKSREESASPSFAELRERRLKREKAEKDRQERLFG